MRLHKFLIIILTVTITAMLYVHQQSKILYLAYQEQEKLVLLEKLNDNKSNLSYNLNCQISLVSMAGLFQDGDFEWPHGKQLVSLSAVQQSVENNKYIKEKQSVFNRIFGLSLQAEATPVKAR